MIYKGWLDLYNYPNGITRKKGYMYIQLDNIEQPKIELDTLKHHYPEFYILYE